MIPIKYYDSFPRENSNLVVFISNISELKNISIISNFNLDIKNKSFKDNLTSNKRIEITSFDNSKFQSKLFIKLINKNDEAAEIGAFILGLFDYKNTKNITLFFSKKIQSFQENNISEIILGLNLKSYSFDKYLNDKKIKPNTILVNKLKKTTINKINYNYNLIYSINYTKNLVSEPGNKLNPLTYCQKLLNLKIKGLKIKILNKPQLIKMGLNALVSVSNGSEIEPKVILLEWNLKKNKKPIVLVGKGVTFDTGGISLKPSSGMEEMITDMAGSAVVVGSMINASLNKSKSSIVGIIGLVENMPDGKSSRPGDIIKSLSGQTIEVLNTDAEGRLVLADILTYIQKKYNPVEIIDFATLTGAIMIALGTHRAGLFSNNNILSNKLIDAGIKSGEYLWRMPLGPEYDIEINSLRADIKNIGSSRYGGSIHAAQFLQRFIKNNIPWAHIDIAGVAWTMKTGQSNITNLHNPGSTAFGVRLIDKFLKGK